MQKIRDWLYIGKYAETAQLEFLKIRGISAMLQLADYVPQPDIKTLYLPVEDGEALPAEQIKKGVSFIREQKALGKTVLVACGAGISRSATFGIAALMELESLELFEAYREILLKHKYADPHFELIISLSAYHGKEMDRREAIDALFAVRKAIRP